MESNSANPLALRRGNAEPSRVSSPEGVETGWLPPKAFAMVKAQSRPRTPSGWRRKPKRHEAVGRRFDSCLGRQQHNMDNLTRAALDDLKAKFGDKAVLTTSELASAIGLTAGAINTIIYRSRKGEGQRFPLEPMPFPVGGGYGYSIYQAAELLAHGTVSKQGAEETHEEPIPELKAEAKKAAPAKPRGRPKTKSPYEELFHWQQAAQAELEKIKTEIEFLRELERALMDADPGIAPGIPSERETL